MQHTFFFYKNKNYLFFFFLQIPILKNHHLNCLFWNFLLKKKLNNHLLKKNYNNLIFKKYFFQKKLKKLIKFWTVLNFQNNHLFYYQINNNSEKFLKRKNITNIIFYFYSYFIKFNYIFIFENLFLLKTIFNYNNFFKNYHSNPQKYIINTKKKNIFNLLFLNTKFI